LCTWGLLLSEGLGKREGRKRGKGKGKGGGVRGGEGREGEGPAPNILT